MDNWHEFLAGLGIGILATLIADNAKIKFYTEKFVRKLIRKPSISIELRSLITYFKDGLLIAHCVELTNNMVLTHEIPNVYLKSSAIMGQGGDSHAYKPIIYFSSNSVLGECIPVLDVLKKFSDKILPYNPGYSDLGLSLIKDFTIRIVILFEVINKNNCNYNESLNSQKVVGDLYSAVANPMPKASPGDSWLISVISQNFGIVERLFIEIPKNLKYLEPLCGSSVGIYRMSCRKPCLSDVGINRLTWPLRFNINDLNILITGGLKRKVVFAKHNIKKEKDFRKKFFRFFKRSKIRKQSFRKNSIKIK